MAFGVGSAKVIMAFDPGSAMTITALGFLMVTDFLTTIGFNVLNASVIGVNAGELFSTKRLGQTAPYPLAPTSLPLAPPVPAFLSQLYVSKATAWAELAEQLLKAVPHLATEGFADARHPYGFGYSTRKSLCVRQTVEGCRNKLARFFFRNHTIQLKMTSRYIYRAAL